MCGKMAHYINSEFAVRPQRVEKYLEQELDAAPLGIDIPIGATDSVEYKDAVMSTGFIRRSLLEYLVVLFPDEFGKPDKKISWNPKTPEQSREYFHALPRRKTNPELIFGGTRNVLNGSNRILDIGCGVASMGLKLSMENPELEIYGVDRAITEKRELLLGQKGLQLTGGNWLDLPVPKSPGDMPSETDQFADMILANFTNLWWLDQGGKSTTREMLIMHYGMDPARATLLAREYETADRAIAQVDRVAKPGAIFRGSGTTNLGRKTAWDVFGQPFEKRGWQVDVRRLLYDFDDNQKLHYSYHLVSAVKEG